jgi:hypothetical protein
VIATFSPTKLSNIHSFSVTENYAIFFFYPVIIDPKARGWREQMFSPSEKSAKFQNPWVKRMCPQACTKAKFWDEIQTKLLRVFLLAIHSHLYGFDLRFLVLQTHATSYSFYSSVNVHCTGERRITDRNHSPFPIHTETSSLITLKILPRNLNEIVRS